MPWAPTTHVCSVPGCPRLTTGRDSRCSLHVPESSPLSSRNHRGVSRQARGLDAEYVRMREIVLAEEPLCYAAGCGHPSTTVDHVRRRVSGGTNERANLRGACTRHNYGRQDDG